MPTKLVFFR